jgi:hypothetical protein
LGPELLVGARELTGMAEQWCFVGVDGQVIATMLKGEAGR